jgi:hypothetical protein
MPFDPHLAETVLDLRPIGDGRTFELERAVSAATRVPAPASIKSFVQAGVTTIEVPAGFITDMASVPRPLWALFPPMGLYNRAAVVHDWCCVQRLGNYRWAASVFLDLMAQDGVPWHTRWPMYLAVRWFGPKW